MALQPSSGLFHRLPLLTIDHILRAIHARSESEFLSFCWLFQQGDDATSVYIYNAPYTLYPGLYDYDDLGHMNFPMWLMW